MCIRDSKYYLRNVTWVGNTIYASDWLNEQLRMKKAILLSRLFVSCVFTASAQKFALIDMEYSLKNIPAYEQANTQLNQASQQYQSEVEAKAKEAEALYKE